MWNPWQRSIWIAGIVTLSIVQPAWAQITPIQSIQVNTGAEGLEMIIETPIGETVQTTIFGEGTNLIIELNEAQLQLPEPSFRQDNPAEGIAAITAVQDTETRVRITVIGIDAQPTVNITRNPTGLTLLIPPVTAELAEEEEEDPPESDAIRVVVTAEDLEVEEGYRVPDASVGTRTDTPILQIPQSVQVIPQEIIQDQGSVTIGDTFRNVSGVTEARRSASLSPATGTVIRGFETNNLLRNGLRDRTLRFDAGLANVERIEFLRGPASVLFGQGSLGGTINIVTEEPQDEAAYGIEYVLGTYGFNRPAIDLTGPLNDEGLAYRLNVSYEFSDSFRAFEEQEFLFIAPTMQLIDTENTSLLVDLEYLRFQSSGTAPELPALGTVVDNPLGNVDFDVNLGEPSITENDTRLLRLGYRLEHRFNDDWLIRNEFLGAFRDSPDSVGITPIRLEPDQRSLVRLVTENPSQQSNYTLNTNIVGNFATGAIDHQLLLGMELSREVDEDIVNFRNLANIDIFDPIYQPESISAFIIPFQNIQTETNSIGIYLQDQITLLENLILVLGGRLDIVSQNYQDVLNPTEGFDRSETAFSPRAGIVYQPLEIVSLYASYTESFEPVIGRERSLNPLTNETILGDPFEPERGRQYEIGVKASLLDERLLATLAVYRLERTNVVTIGADSPASQVQVGEQRSQGVELDVVGEILPGWNVIASYAYTDAKVTRDNQFDAGNQLPNAPRHAASLWTTYELQSGDLQGLGFGAGLFFVGEREGDLNNTFSLPSYVRTDAAVFYRRGRLRASLNFQNLFDVEYYVSARNDVRVIPGQPFTVLGRIAWEF